MIFDGNGAKKAHVEGTDADVVWRQLHDEVCKAHPKYFGVDGARARFLRFFPNGFHSAGYTNAERDYKIAAKQRLDETAPLEKAVGSFGLGEAVLAVFRATNLVSPFEKVRLQDVLRGPKADAFIHAAARLALGEGKSALLDLECALKPHESAKWTVAIYLRFLWPPEEHMFLKPEATQDFGARVGQRFAWDYDARLDLAVYASLQDLTSKTAAELVELKPRDGIDVQSFIWVLGNNSEDSEQPTPIDLSYWNC